MGPNGWLFVLLAAAALGAKLAEWLPLRPQPTRELPQRQVTGVGAARLGRLAAQAERRARRQLLDLAGSATAWSGRAVVAAGASLGPVRGGESTAATLAGRRRRWPLARRIASLLRHEAVLAPASLLLVLLWMQACLAGGTTPSRVLLAVCGAIALATVDGRRADTAPRVPVSRRLGRPTPRRTAPGRGR